MEKITLLKMDVADDVLEGLGRPPKRGSPEIGLDLNPRKKILPDDLDSLRLKSSAGLDHGSILTISRRPR